MPIASAFCRDSESTQFWFIKEQYFILGFPHLDRNSTLLFLLKCAIL